MMNGAEHSTVNFHVRAEKFKKAVRFVMMRVSYRCYMRFSCTGLCLAVQDNQRRVPVVLDLKQLGIFPFPFHYTRECNLFGLNSILSRFHDDQIIRISFRPSSNFVSFSNDYYCFYPMVSRSNKLLFKRVIHCHDQTSSCLRDLQNANNGENWTVTQAPGMSRLPIIHMYPPLWFRRCIEQSFIMESRIRHENIHPYIFSLPSPGFLQSLMTAWLFKGLGLGPFLTTLTDCDAWTKMETGTMEDTWYKDNQNSMHNWSFEPENVVEPPDGNYCRLELYLLSCDYFIFAAELCTSVVFLINKNHHHTHADQAAPIMAFHLEIGIDLEIYMPFDSDIQPQVWLTNP